MPYYIQHKQGWYKNIFTSIYMWVFKASGVILKIHKWRDGNFLYTIFSDAYGKIMCSKKYSKTEKTVDIGYVANFEIITKNKSNIHSIRNIKIISELSFHDKSFSQLNSYLELIALIFTTTAPWVANREIFSLIPSIHKVQEKPDIACKLTLTKLKYIDISWDLDINHSDPTAQKILWFIHRSSIQDILKLTGISHEIEILLKNHILKN